MTPYTPIIQQIPNLPELTLQAQCFQYFHNTYPDHRQMLFHVQNKARNAIEGSKFKAIGVVKGVSDFILILPFKVVFIELKTELGTQSPDQVTFQAKVSARGHTYKIVRSFEEFKNVIKNYII